MKKLDKLILKSYLGPLALTFSISMFVLVLTFLWRKMETMIGKGLELSVIAELFVYASATFIPLALPLTILLASIMTMGNFGERSELTAMKSAGIPLWRVFRPLIVLAIIFALVAFYFASFVIPNAELRVKQLASDIKDKKPALNIRPDEFCTQISSYVIRVDAKNKNTDMMYGILIYDHSKERGNSDVIKADSGYMYSAENGQTMIFRLYSGEVFSEDLSNANYHSRPLTRIAFKQQTLRFDVSDFALQESDKDKYSDHYMTIDIVKLYHQIDSLRTWQAISDKRYNEYVFKRLAMRYDTAKAAKAVAGYDFYKDYAQAEPYIRQRADSYAKDNLREMAENYETNGLIRENDELYLTKHWIEFYKKFTLSVGCIVLFFIGAPLGAIIRKGGLGMPVVVSILAFGLYYILGTACESAAKSGTLSPFLAMWLPSLIFLPLGLFLTIKATSDSKLMSAENWQRIFAKTFSRFKTRKVKQENNR